MRNMGNVAGNVDELRSQREARKNPPQYEAGQGDDADWSFLDEDFNSNSSMDESAFRGSLNNTPYSSSDISALGGNPQNPMSKEQLAKNMTSTEDKIIEVGIQAGKVAYNSSKELFSGIRTGLFESNPFFWTVYGKRVLYAGLGIAGVGIIFFILGLLTNLFSGGFWVIIGGAFLAMIGLIVFSLNYDKSKDYIENSVNSDTVENKEEWGSFDESSNEVDFEEDNPWKSFDDSFEDDVEEEYQEDDDLLSIWGNLDDVEEESSVVSGVYEEDVNIDSAIDSIREIPAHTQTRQYLFEEYSRVLPLKNPEFSKLKTISENSDNFIIFDKILYDAALQVGTKEDSIPELVELRENSFIIQLKSTRPSGLKEEEIANEIANIYSKDEFGGIEHEGVYATTSSVGSNFIINIFKGENSLITLADTYREVKDFVLNPNVRKPIVIGVNELGRVWKFDAEKVFSYIISGKPRTGKSWVAASLVLQLAMYSSPKEVTFEAFDVKKTSSDFYEMKNYLPHFKVFEGDPKRILSRLRYLTTVEAERRRKILDSNGVLNIADLKAKGTDVEIPYVYIIIDEIVGLKSKMSKDENAEFQELVNTIVTQMPNYGFRVILVPHRVTNDIISKTTYTLIGFVACVKSDFKEINTTLEVSKKEFPYTLANVGDMALKSGEINRGSTVFSHGLAITSTNEGNKGVYRFVGSLWNMLEPEETENKSTKSEDYKGHDLVGVNSVLEDDDYLSSDDNIEEDFWKDVLGEE